LWPWPAAEFVPCSRIPGALPQWPGFVPSRFRQKLRFPEKWPGEIAAHRQNKVSARRRDDLQALIDAA
jgi:hypothetical protein